MIGAASPYASTTRTMRSSPSRERRVRLALVAPAKQQHGGARHAVDRDLRRADVRRLGVVDPEHAAELADELEAVRRARGRSAARPRCARARRASRAPDPLRSPRATPPARSPRCDRRAAEAPRARESAAPVPPNLVRCRPRARIASRRSRSRCRSARCAPATPAAMAMHARIVGVEHPRGLLASRCERAAPCRRSTHRRTRIGRDGRARGWSARQLSDRTLGVSCSWKDDSSSAIHSGRSLAQRDLGERRADVARVGHALAERAEEMTDERCGGGLAVGAGDGDVAHAGQQTQRDLDLAHDRHAWRTALRRAAARLAARPGSRRRRAARAMRARSCAPDTDVDAERRSGAWRCRAALASLPRIGGVHAYALAREQKRRVTPLRPSPITAASPDLHSAGIIAA